MNATLGTLLHHEDRQHVLAAYVHRYTREGWWTVKLKVTYSDGSTRSFSTQVHTYIIRS